jgi:hypothetical protein
VTGEELYVVLGLFMVRNALQKPALESYFSMKRVLSVQVLKLLQQSAWN